MGYFFLLLQALIFSFGGILIKTTATAFSPFMVSFLRFALGVLFLLALQVMRGRKPRLTLANRLVIFGGIAKALHYLGENYGVMRGFSYGTVVVWPVQTVVILLFSTLVLKEKVTRRAVVGAFLCVSGIVLLTWNGTPLSEFIGNQGPLLIAFVIAGTGASLFSVCQKKLLARLDTVELNTSMFLIGGLCAGGVVPLGGAAVTGPIRLPAAAAMLILGAITGVGFLLQAEGFKRVPLFVATVVQSSTVLLSLLWAALLYHERITGWIIAGTALFLAGILCVNAKPGGR
jgi:drug/metabolite transporter (DMT)-like permease